MHDDYTAALRRHGANLPSPYNDPAWQLAETQRFLDLKLSRYLSGGFNILEIGPGACPALYLLRAAGNEVWGSDCVVEAPTGKSMVAAYKRIAEYLNLRVVYHGFEHYLLGDPVPVDWPKFDLIILRRSLSAVMTAYGRNLYDIGSVQLVALWHDLLNVRGVVYIQHNHGAAQEAFQSVVEQDDRMYGLSPEVNTESECILVRR